MAEPRKAILLRIAPELHDSLARWADDELRSINGQIEYLLRQAVRKAGRLPGDSGAAEQQGARPEGGAAPEP